MKQMFIIVLAIAMNSFALANGPVHTAPAQPPVATSAKPEKAVKKLAMVKISKEQREKCKTDHKGDKKGYMECLKSTQ